jgi:hypothetical protein
VPDTEVPPIDSSAPAEKGSAGPEPVDDGGDGPDDGGDGPEDLGFKGTAKGALDFLRANLGLGETPEGSNRNFITEQFFEGAGRPSELTAGAFAWCGATVSLALNTAWGSPREWRVPGVRASYRSGTAHVPSLRTFFVQAKRFDDKPRVGDVMIYGPGDPEGSHAGLVEEVLDDGTVITLDGNWSDKLVRVRRSPADIVGFGHPPYSTEEDSFMSLSPEEQKDLLATTKATNAAVARLEVAIRDPKAGLQAQIDELRRKIEELGK